jgi:putative DeoR family transcriptional regulator (stage III sporulation protein D)
MHWFDKERCIAIAEYVIETRDTVRGAALHFGISKSTVHKDITEKLKISSPALYHAAKEVMDTNKSERHLRGGAATKRKYLQKQKI